MVFAFFLDKFSKISTKQGWSGTYHILYIFNSWSRSQFLKWPNQTNKLFVRCVCVCDLWEKIVPNTFRIGRSIFLNNFSTKSYLKSQLSLCYRKSMHCFPSVNPQLLFYFLTNPLWFLFSQIRRYRLLGLVSITLPYFFISFISI